jgi:hypothetical protein
MHDLKTLERINAEWPRPLNHREEQAIRHLEQRLGVRVDRDDPMLAAAAALEMAISREAFP